MASLFLRMLNRTLRWQTVGLDGVKKYWPSGAPRILAFWHNQQLLMPWIYLNGSKRADSKPIAVLISEHQDGRMVAKAMKFLGVESIAGSSSRGGRKALFDLIGKLKSGSHIAVTPDGPKGPPQKMRDGVIRIAQRSGAMIYPTAMASEKRWEFASWDRMFLPKPFSRAVIIMGEPIAIPADLSTSDLARYSTLVEDRLNAVTQQAEQYRYN